MRSIALLLCLVLLTGCARSPVETTPETIPETSITSAPATAPETSHATEETSLPPDPVGELLSAMTIQERVGQLFLIRCDADTVLRDIGAYHPGGILFFGQDFESQTPVLFRQTVADYQAAASVPMLLAVDEEGGTVTRISQFPAFRDSRFPSPRTAYSRGGMEGALDNEEDICRFLSDLGLNVNLGPVCDISTSPEAFMYRRSLGQDAETTAVFASGTVGLMRRYQIGSVLKHFPGYGNNSDTHTGIAVDDRSLDTLEGTDLRPFAAGIEAGCGAILVSHTIVNALDAELPASLSPAVHSYLREVMGFDGVILTDDLYMEAITDAYGAGEAAVMAVQAGNDLLCATDYGIQYEAVLAAALDGRIDYDSLNASVRRVLEWKMELGLL